MNKKIIRFITLLTVLSFLTISCAAPATPEAAAQPSVAVDEVVAEGRMTPIHAADLFFQARGVVEEVLVKPGDSVKPGDVLIRLANAGQAQAQVVVAQNDYDKLLRNASGSRADLWQAYMDSQIVRAKAEKKWDDLNVDDLEDDIEDDKATLEDRMQDLKDAQEDFDKYKDLDTDNSKRKNAEDDLENAQEDVNQAQRDLEESIRKRDDVRAIYDSALAVEAEAQHQFEISLDGPNAEQLTLVKANLEAAKDALSNYIVTAPFNATVADVNVEVGDQITVETRAISLADFSQWIVETTDVNELEVVKLTVGQKVNLIPDALPDLMLVGTITEISNAYTLQGGDILYKVKINVTNPDPRLRWGMTVEATFVQ